MSPFSQENIEYLPSLGIWDIKNSAFYFQSLRDLDGIHVHSFPTSSVSDKFQRQRIGIISDRVGLGFGWKITEKKVYLLELKITFS